MCQRLLLIATAAVLVAQVLSCGGRQGIKAPSPDRLATPAIEVLVKQALEDRLAARNLPDSNLLGKSTRIAIREDMPAAGLKLGRGALPQREGYEFYLISEGAAQAEADRARQPVTFIAVDGPSITEDTAMVSLGVDVVFPREPKQTKLCCCTGRGEFRRAEGRWTFVKWADMICS